MPAKIARPEATVVGAFYCLIILAGCTTIDAQGQAHRTDFEPQENLPQQLTPQFRRQFQPQQNLPQQTGICASECANGCPDDYCPKPSPPQPCACRNVYCNDYCSKPAPTRPCRARWFYCDDYCPKCWQFGPCPPVPGATCQKGTATGYQTGCQ